jgi:pimeloyl-ACP methyl ester carboxylesterase
LNAKRRRAEAPQRVLHEMPHPAGIAGIIEAPRRVAHHSHRTRLVVTYRHHQITIGHSSIHVVTAGHPRARPFLFLHGWPESWRSWRALMDVAGEHARVLAIDLPGIGDSTGAVTDGSKTAIAAVVHQLIAELDLHDLTLVGQDAGGMVVYAYLRQYADIARAVIMNVVLPGLDPWDQVIRNPRIWHFAFHAIPALPEHLVQGRQREYFSYFYNLLAAKPEAIDSDARAEYVHAYASDSALTAGFDLYRAFEQDVRDNRATVNLPPVATPLLYIRGENEPGDIDEYASGLRKAGVLQLQHAHIRGAGHFAHEEAPVETWRVIADFAELR